MQDALTWVEQISGPSRRRTRWFARRLLVFGAGTVPAVAAMAVLRGPVGLFLLALLLLAFLAGITYSSRRHPIGLTGAGLRHTLVLVSWTVLFLAVSLGGLTWFDGVLAWWLGGSLVVSAPCFVGAWVELRR